MFSSHKRSIGLDIADHTIEVAELEEQGKSVRLVSKARVALPSGVVEHGQIKQPERLAEVLRGLFSSTEPRVFSKAPITFGLPESQVYTHTFRFSDLSQKQIDEALPKTVASAIPIPTDKLVFRSLVTYTKGKQTDVVIVATHRDMFHEWEEFFVSHGFSIAAVDSEILASFRDLFVAPVSQPVCVVDIGAMTTFVSIFDAHGLRYTRTIFLAGEDFTQTIAASTQIDHDQAEQEKITFGISASDEKQWRSALVAQIDSVVSAVHSTISFFEKTRSEKVNEVVVIGGSAQMPGLIEYVKEKIGYSARMGQSICSDTPLEYIEAVGLARFGLEGDRWKRRDPIFTFSKKADSAVGVAPRLSRKNVMIAAVALGVCVMGLLAYFGYAQYQVSKRLQLAAIVTTTIDIAESIPGAVPTSTPQVFFRIVSSDGQRAPIYEQPTSTAPVITEAEAGERFLILGTDSERGFTQIEVDTLTGWVESTLGEEVVQEE